MKDIRQFSSNQLFGIKASDNWVRTGTKVAVVGRFDPNGSVRPGFVVNMMSTEGVSGASQVIRFEQSSDAERWLREKGVRYGYDEGDLSLVKNRGTQEFVRIPLADFEVDAWVNSVFVDRITPSNESRLVQYAPEYWRDETPVPTPIEARPQYRGFRF